MSSPSAASEIWKLRIGMVISLLGIALALVFYLRLFFEPEVMQRTAVFRFFLFSLLPIILIHTALYLLAVLGLKWRAPGMAIFWSVSAIALLAAGGWQNCLSMLLIVLFGFLLFRIGCRIAAWLFPPEAINWGLSLSLAIVALSVIGAFLAWIHLFTWWLLAAIVLLALIPDIRNRFAELCSDVRVGWNGFVSSWSFSKGFALQSLFLTGGFAFVTAMAPETHSDAVRFYWPYLRLLRHYSGFFDGQFQWSYIIPQAGLIYGSVVLSLLGTSAVRLVMLLAWAALIGMICRRIPGQASGLQLPLAAVLASTPIVLWVAPSLMLDTFVCSVVIVLAVLCFEGRNPGSIRFWAAIGIGVASAWAAKFSTLAYVAPLLVAASIRSIRAAGVAKTLCGAMVSGGCLLAALAPWLYHSYEQSGNPVFPFLNKVFPSPLWPRGVGFGNLDNFRLPPGWRGWLLWPFDLTYHTARFVEGFDGKLGLTLLIALFLASIILWKGNLNGRLLILATSIGTALLWSQTAYLRYWLPSLWLVGLAASYPLKKPASPIRMAPAFAVAAFVVLLPQLFFVMINFWSHPQGWPWKVYTGKLDSEAYLGGAHKELAKEIQQRKILGKDYPKIWFTNYEAVGHLPVQPMEATVWEEALHTLDPRSQVQYLASAGCKYWIVNEEGSDAKCFHAKGISRFFWNEFNLIARSGDLAIYQMPSMEKVLHDFDARGVIGTELLMNGSFETGKSSMPAFWLSNGNDPARISPSQPFDGAWCVQLIRNSGLSQGVALPLGLKKVELLFHARAAQGADPAAFRYQIYTLGFEKDPATIPPKDQVQPDRALTGKEEKVTAGKEWQEFRLSFAIPDLARFVVVNLDKPEGSSEVWIDGVHLLVCL